MNELVRKMLDAWYGDPPRQYDEMQIEFMGRALEVALGEALKEPSQDELLRHEKPWGHKKGDTALRYFLADRRSRLLSPPAPLSLAERIARTVDELLQSYGVVRADYVEELRQIVEKEIKSK